jgi:hypothetical protein
VACIDIDGIGRAIEKDDETIQILVEKTQIAAHNEGGRSLD